MKIIELEQGSQKWLDFRNGLSEHGIVVSASRVPSILKEHAYSGSFSHEVFGELLGARKAKDLSRNPAVQRGHRLEPEAVAYINALMGVEGKNPVGISEKYPWLSASFDWFHSDGGVWEIKSTGRKVFDRAKVEGIPTYYKAQMETQMIVTDDQFREGYMLMWPPDDGPEDEAPLEIPLILTKEREKRIVTETRRFLDDLEAALLGDESRIWVLDPMEQARARAYRGAGGDTFTPASDLPKDELAVWNEKMQSMLVARKDRLLAELQLKSCKKEEDEKVAGLVSVMFDTYGYELCEDEATGTRISAKMADGSVKYKELAEYYEAQLGLSEDEAQQARDQFAGDGRRSVRVTALVDKEVKPPRKKAA